jgi:hypothetical protein
MPIHPRPAASSSLEILREEAGGVMVTLNRRPIRRLRQNGSCLFGLRCVWMLDAAMNSIEPFQE